MLDITLIRENPDKYRKAAESKGLNPDSVDRVLGLDKERRELLVKIESLRALRNTVQKELKSERTDSLIEKSKQLKLELLDLEPILRKVEADLATMMLVLPSTPDESVPLGSDESGNVEVSIWGNKPEFDFKPKDHIQLGVDLDILDLDRGSKVSGYRGYFLKNEAVMMQFGIMRYALDKLTAKGFTPMIPPIVVKTEAFVNSGHFPWGEREAYALMPDDPDGLSEIGELGSAYRQATLNNRSNTYLAGTAEVPLVSYHAGEVLRENDLPLKYCGFSPCYRREIGSYGKDTRGIYRVHEFMKIEQVVLCTNDWDESVKWHENLRTYAEEMLQELGLHYRVLLMCTGDMGEPQIKKYDIETFMVGRGAFGETMSDSIMGDFQSRRAGIRYQAKDGTLKYVHMLNNTALASPRILIALWEHYQQKDGSILIPEVLRPYVGINQITNKN